MTGEIVFGFVLGAVGMFISICFVVYAILKDHK